MFKKIICLVLVVALLCPTLAMAEALREDPKAVGKKLNRSKPTDIFFEEFTGVAEGSLPTSVPAGANITTAPYEVAPGYTKNCLQITDTTPDNTYSGVSANVNFGTVSGGKVEFEMRYKYIPTDGSNWSSFDIGLYDSAGAKPHRLVVASANGATHFNYGYADTAALESSRISHDTWYTYRLIIDFDEQQITGTLKNEGTGSVGTKAQAAWMDGNKHNDISRLELLSQVYSGIWVIDYVRVGKYDGTLEIEEDPYANIQKGVEQIKIPAPVNGAVEGRINITKDGVYKYVTSAPYVSEETGDILMTAKNFADINGLGYLRQGDVFTVTKGDKAVTFTSGSADVKIGSKKDTLKEKAVRKGTQLYVSVKSLCEIFDVAYGYDADNQTILLETLSEEVKEGEEE